MKDFICKHLNSILNYFEYFFVLRFIFYPNWSFGLAYLNS